MKQIMKQVGIYIAIILILTGVFVGMGTLSALIPHDAVAENIVGAAVLLADRAEEGRLHLLGLVALGRQMPR